MGRRRDYYRHTALISSLTLLSRVLGVVRDVACASIFGAGMVWDAFSFAWRVPNLFRRLFGEGALTAAFLPVFTEYLRQKGRRHAWQLLGVVGSLTALVLLGCVLLGEALAFFLPHVVDLSERWRLAVALTAVLLPYMVFVCLTALAGAALNSLKHFSAPALAPIVINLCWIVSVLVVAPRVSSKPSQQIFVVAAGILVAGALQLGLQLSVLSGKGAEWWPSLSISDPGVKRIGKAMAPVALGMAAFQVNVLLDGVIAISLAAPAGEGSFVLFGRSLPYPMEIGANSVLWYASRLMQFPLGVFGIALATAIFPALSDRAADGEWEEFDRTLTDGLGATLFIGIPAGIGLMVVGRPAVELLFEHGEFTARATARTAGALFCYSTGIWAYCAYHVLTRAYYSLEDSVTLARVAGFAVLLNVVLNLTLIWFLGASGLALATALSSAVQCAILYLILRRKGRSPEQLRLLATLIKTLLAGAAMAALCLVIVRVVIPPVPGAGLPRELGRLLLPVAAGALLFFALARALNVPEARLVTRIIRRRWRK